jgi:hypothetical protein
MGVTLNGYATRTNRVAATHNPHALGFDFSLICKHPCLAVIFGLHIVGEGCIWLQTNGVNGRPYRLD